MASSRSTIWLDANGYQTIQLLRSVSGATSLSAAIAAASNAARVYYWESPETTYVGPVPVSAPYLPGNLVALFTYQNADLTYSSLRVPAPALAIFFADGQSVDPSNPLVAAINTAAIGALVGTSGSPAASFVSGKLQPLT